MPEWVKTLLIALATSFFTVCLIEPIRAAIGRWIRKREMRRSLYHEMALNFNALDGQVVMASHDPMKAGTHDRFGRSFKRSGFDLALRDRVIYYGMGFDERYWIELLYSSMEHIITGRFRDDEQRRRHPPCRIPADLCKKPISQQEHDPEGQPYPIAQV